MAAETKSGPLALHAGDSKCGSIMKYKAILILHNKMKYSPEDWEQLPDASHDLIHGPSRMERDGKERSPMKI